MTAPEFSRMIDVRQADGRSLLVAAEEAERAALSRRFELVRIDRLEASVTLSRAGEAVSAGGTLSADIIQACAISAEDLPVRIREDVSFRFVPARSAHAADEEVELDVGELDEIEYTGTSFDLGEAVAQSLALAIDPFAVGPEAEKARALLQAESASPFAALKGKFTS